MSRSFNGSSDVIDCGSGVNQPAQATIAGWVFPTVNNANYKGMFGRNNAAHTQNLIIFLSSTNFRYYANGSINVDPGATTVSMSTWYHVALSYDSVGGLKTYINGASDGTAAASGALGSQAGAHFFIGDDANTASRFFGGNIDNVAQWNVVLTAAEVLALAKGARPNTIRPGSTQDGYWPLDGTSSPEPDYSGNANNGTLTGTALAAGSPSTIFTPRWPQFLTPAAAAATTVFRRGLSSLGTRTGSRQVEGWT